MTNRIATFGAGIGYRRPLMNALWADPSRVDVLEILTDGWMAAGGLTDLCELAKTFTVTPHGVSLSLAGPGRPDPAYITRLAEIIDVVGAPYYSEHLAVTEIPGIDTGHLCPPVLSPTSLRQCVGNARTVQSELGVPLAIENITYTIALPSAGLDGPDFFAELVEKADSLILLDVTNLYINSVNHRFDVADYLDRIPLERVVHIHLAGGLTMHGKMVDSHSELIGEEIWELAGEVASRCRPATVILEHDNNFPNPEVLLAEVDRARTLFFADAAGTTRSHLP